MKDYIYLDMSEYMCGVVDDATVPVAGSDGAWFRQWTYFLRQFWGFWTESTQFLRCRVSADRAKRFSPEVALYMSEQQWMQFPRQFRLISRVSRVLPFSALEAEFCRFFISLWSRGELGS